MLEWGKGGKVGGGVTELHNLLLLLLSNPYQTSISKTSISKIEGSLTTAPADSESWHNPHGVVLGACRNARVV